MNDFAQSVELAGYPVAVAVPIQWGDQDAFGHVNNTVHVRWFESARVAYIQQCGFATELRRGDEGPILASVECHYRRQLNFPDTVLVGARISRIGHSSMTMEHAVYSTAQGAQVADGRSVIVMFDYARQKPQRVSDDLRKAIESLENR